MFTHNRTKLKVIFIFVPNNYRDEINEYVISLQFLNIWIHFKYQSYKILNNFILLLGNKLQTKFRLFIYA